MPILRIEKVGFSETDIHAVSYGSETLKIRNGTREMHMKNIIETGTPTNPSEAKTQIGFFLTPDYSPLGLISAIEVLRTTNRYVNEYRYGWYIISMTGENITAANGITTLVDHSIDTVPTLSALFICAGFHPENHCDSTTLAWLRNLQRHGTNIGGISTSTYILAKAGVIGKRSCTIHQDNAPSFQEHFPQINLCDNIFVNDRGLLTCAGGTSAIDMFIHMVSEELEDSFAADLAHQFQQDRVRNSEDQLSKFKNTALSIKSPKVLQAVDLMKNNIEAPLSIEDLSIKIDITSRQLLRLFRKYTGRAPKEFYRNLRLHHGRLLLLQTNMPVFEIAMACGFKSHTHFTNAYKREFGYSPTLERRQAL